MGRGDTEHDNDAPSGSAMGTGAARGAAGRRACSPPTAEQVLKLSLRPGRAPRWPQSRAAGLGGNGQGGPGIGADTPPAPSREARPGVLPLTAAYLPESPGPLTPSPHLLGPPPPRPALCPVSRTQTPHGASPPSSSGSRCGEHMLLTLEKNHCVLLGFLRKQTAEKSFIKI